MITVIVAVVRVLVLAVIVAVVNNELCTPLVTKKLEVTYLIHPSKELQCASYQLAYNS